ncbi:MAG: c-type cytochrome [Candidatus Limnocylindria bacterium]
MRAALSAIAAGIAVLAGAALIPLGTLRWEEGFADSYDLIAPFRATPEAVARGRAIYTERCVACHGPLGRGNGPLAAPLDPPPADLVLHVPQHPDGELYWYVTRGSPGTAMPAWDAVLSEEERWSVVHYLRQLAAGAP